MTELRKWIEESVNDVTKNKRILILFGPPGSAKETAVKVITEEINVNILEWKNPDERLFSLGEIDDLAEVPTEFIKFKSVKDDTCLQFIDFIHSSTLGYQSKSLVLIKEYPHILNQNKNEFEQILYKD